MTTAKAGDVRERMREAALGRQTAASPLVPAAASPAPVSLRTQREETVTRYALRLPHELHRFLRQYALDHHIDASEVVRALLSLLEQDPALSDRVLDQVKVESMAAGS
jgi:hypothetical protein